MNKIIPRIIISSFIRNEQYVEKSSETSLRNPELYWQLVRFISIDTQFCLGHWFGKRNVLSYFTK